MKQTYDSRSRSVGHLAMGTARSRVADTVCDGALGNVAHARAGVTLSEVLVSMLVMSIGVVSLATLFPISVLRTAQATQLTHAVFLRNNAQGAVQSNLALFSNTNLAPSGAMPPLPVTGVIDPLGFNLVGGALGGIAARSVGNVALVPSLPDSWSLVFEDQVVSYNPSTPSITVNLSPASYGINLAAPTTPTYRLVITDATGKFAAIKTVTAVSGTTMAWSTAALPAALVPARVRVEVQQIRYTYMLTVRKSFTVPDGGTALNPNWTADVDVAVFFNRFFKPATTAAAAVAGDETPFSLMYPVNGVSSVAGIAVPTTGSLPSGTGFDGAPGVIGVDDDGNGVTDFLAGGGVDPGEMGFAGSDDNRTVIISLANVNALGNVTSPYVKKGSYLLEASSVNNMMEWYRIVDFNVTSGVVTVLLDRDIMFDPTKLAAPNPTLQGIFLKGVVDVFPLGSVSGQN